MVSNTKQTAAMTTFLIITPSYQTITKAESMNDIDFDSYNKCLLVIRLEDDTIDVIKAMPSERELIDDDKFIEQSFKSSQP